MKIVRERPCQRRHHRVVAPLKVTLPNGETLKATNWSLGGLRLDGVSSKLPKVGKTISLILELPFQGFDISFDVQATVMRVRKKKNSIGFEFNQLSERAHDLMEHFINDLVRGQMATIDDTICRIDIPVTPISTKPDTNPKEDMPIKRWPIKTIVMSTFYIFLGVFVFSYLAILIYSNTMRMEVDTAVVTSQLNTIKMPVDGTVIPIRMERGTFLSKGQPIARIQSSDLERRLALKTIEYKEKQRDYQLAVRRYQIEEQRLKLYEMSSQTEQQIALAQLEAARAALTSADRTIERLKEITHDDELTQRKLDAALIHQAEIEARVKEMSLRYERASAMKSASNRRYFTDQGFIADLDLLTLNIEEANTKVAKVQDEIEYLESEKEELILKAPFDGHILRVAELSGRDRLMRDQSLLTIQKKQRPIVEAYLSQDQVISIGLHDEANIYLPSLGQTVVAKVIKIDRHAGQVDEEYKNYVWREDDAKSARVSLEIDPSRLGGATFNAGLPAVVIFARKSTNNIYNKIGNVMSNVADAFGTGVFEDDNSV